MATRLLSKVYTRVRSYWGGVAVFARRRSVDRSFEGITRKKGVAPKPGTKLTPERISENLRALSRGWDAKKDGRRT